MAEPSSLVLFYVLNIELYVYYLIILDWRRSVTAFLSNFKIKKQRMISVLGEERETERMKKEMKEELMKEISTTTKP
ncbi:MAG: hypothetical protein WBX01_15730 [Nitrososphaeraceae archaeon]|jgi:hypothetical protein